MHLIAAIMASSAIAWPFGPSTKGHQVPICDQSPSRTQSEPSVVMVAPYPPTRLASATNVILRIYNNTRCNGTYFLGEFDVPPDTCYYFPGQGAELLYHSCGQVWGYLNDNCTTGATIIPVHACYNVLSFHSLKVLGC